MPGGSVNELYEMSKWTYNIISSSVLITTITQARIGICLCGKLIFLNLNLFHQIYTYVSSYVGNLHCLGLLQLQTNFDDILHHLCINAWYILVIIAIGDKYQNYYDYFNIFFPISISNSVLSRIVCIVCFKCRANGTDWRHSHGHNNPFCLINCAIIWIVVAEELWYHNI